MGSLVGSFILFFGIVAMLIEYIVVFTGGESSEQIKMWDIRARAAVYELSTGNNAVAGLAWDLKHSSLYAATECRCMDRMGNWRDYRRAIVPSSHY
jgi:hypothetical protein